MLLSTWWTGLRRSRLLPQVSISSCAHRKSRLQHFSCSLLKHVSNTTFCKCSDFLTACWYLISARPSKNISTYQTHSNSCGSFDSFIKLLCILCFLALRFSPFFPFKIYFLNSFLAFLLSTPQNSLSQNNNNKLSDSARWPAHTPEETESHSSTPTDNPPRKASLPPSGTMLSFTREWP